jgi:hypothetical protein
MTAMTRVAMKTMTYTNKKEKQMKVFTVHYERKFYVEADNADEALDKLEPLLVYLDETDTYKDVTMGITSAYVE